MSSGSTKTIAIVAGCAVVMIGIFLYLLLGGTAVTPTSAPSDPNSGENQLASARDALVKETDLMTCRSALSQITTYYAQTSKDHPPSLDSETREKLQKHFALEDDEIKEIEGDSYTLLDAHHLDQCFLLRDAAKSIEAELRGTDTKTRLSPLDQATAAFAWVVRQIRLQDSVFQTVPPQFALRRGWGTPLDRALVFVALLEQFGTGEDRKDGRPNLLGCLVCFPGKPDGFPELWACGVVIENDANVYLFDPRLGLPIPGPNGKGIATLAQARKDSTVLAQLTVKPEHAYDVTAKRALDANLYQYVSLSALAPRMRHLQGEKVLYPSVRVNLAVDALEDEKKLRAAAAAASDTKPVGVKVFPRGHTLLRAFLPKEEGGSDVDPQPIALNLVRGFGDPNNRTLFKIPQRQLFEIELVPWFDLPEGFRDQTRFPFNVGLGQQVRGQFAAPFTRFALEPKQGRDLMLRGRQRVAIEELAKERLETVDHQREMSRLMKQPDLNKRLDEWVERAFAAHAAALRARGNAAAMAAAKKEIEQLGKQEPAQALTTLLQGAVAKTRAQETTYYLALCKHDQAEQLQTRLNLTAQTKGTPPEKAEAQWNDALDWWRRFVEEYPEAPEREAARRLRGQAFAAVGKRDEAIKIWESDVPGHTRTLEKVACLYLAEQARKKE